MRPAKLTIQGLTAYKEQIEVDFSELDLFAITGPTGAGKSSLVDAITFALFGQAPRVGRSVKELISQGSDRLKVSLEFTANGGSYRIHRSTARRGTAPVQLERWDATENDWRPEEVDRVRSANQFIEELLHMDYDAFVRSVILPQGQFQEFLSGNPEQRRKVIDDLLQLGVYAAMQQRANSIAARHGEDAERIHERLETELRDATPEALKKAKAHLKELEVAVAGLAKTREVVAAAVGMADALAEARKRWAAAQKALAETEKRLADAKKLMAGGEETLAALDEKINRIAEQMKDAAYDSDLHLRLVGCIGPLKALDELAARESKLADDIKNSAATVAKHATAVEQAKAKHATALGAAKSAHDAYEAARDANAAARLQTNVKTGDPCPVCGQKVGHLEVGKSVDSKAFERLRGAAETAKAAADKANAALQDATLAHTRAQDAATRLQEQWAQAKTDRQQRTAEVERLLPEPGLTVAAVESRTAALENARRALEGLEAQHKGLVSEREREASAIAGAQTDAREAEAAMKSHTGEVEKALADGKQLHDGLSDAARDMRWDDVTSVLSASFATASASRRPPQDERVSGMLRSRLASVEAEKTAADREIGSQDKHISVVEANIKLAKELRAKEKEHREIASNAKDLASLLKTDRFPTFIRERALQVLAREGSRQLEEISSGRYEFEVQGQDFLIVDRWNGGETRSVKTLSGGETFLASLALALALAEHLPSLGGNGAQASLESLFIDEGFSHLDVETLDIVASALEVLGQDRRRLIGVVTHVPALAERMPARIVVHKSQAGSTVSVE